MVTQKHQGATKLSDRNWVWSVVEEVTSTAIRYTWLLNLPKTLGGQRQSCRDQLRRFKDYFTGLQTQKNILEESQKRVNKLGAAISLSSPLRTAYKRISKNRINDPAFTEREMSDILARLSFYLPENHKFLSEKFLRKTLQKTWRQIQGKDPSSTAINKALVGAEARAAYEAAMLFDVPYRYIQNITRKKGEIYGPFFPRDFDPHQVKKTKGINDLPYDEIAEVLKNLFGVKKNKITETLILLGMRRDLISFLIPTLKPRKPKRTPDKLFPKKSSK